MGVFDKFSDAPNLIKKEGQEITIRFQRTGPTTGRVSWSIPSSAAGCAKDASSAYAGMLITLNSKASNYLSNSPKNGTFYNGDATGDPDVHAGDKLDGAMVIAALYDDTVTSYVDIADILPRTAYYVSGYAIDAQARYHREGVHAYSLPTGESSSMPDKAARHDIVIDVAGGVTGSTSTGLLIDTQYTLKLLINGKPYSIIVDGENVSNYNDLVSELKEKMALLGDVFVSPLAPNTNSLYYNSKTKELKQWNGIEYIDLVVLTHHADPQASDTEVLWYEPKTKILSRWSHATGWGGVEYITAHDNPSSFTCDQTWFDSLTKTVWQYKKTHWEKLYTYSQPRNPLLGATLSCDDYWYNTADASVSVWNIDNKKWDAVNVIYHSIDPNTLNTGDYWYDETTAKVKQFVAGVWSEADTKYLETLPATTAEYTDAANTHAYIFATDTGKLFKLFGSTWAEQVIVAFPTDPRNRDTSNLWWNSNTGIDKLYAWDAMVSQWKLVTAFTQSAIDPSFPVALVANSAWHNSATGEIKLVFKTSCRAIYPIVFAGTPINFSIDTVWYNTESSEWFAWDGSAFQHIEPMYYATDPCIVTSNYYWFDLTTDTLKRWTGTVWVTVTYTGKPVVNAVGDFWFNSVNDQLYMWNGTGWVESVGFASLELIPAQSAIGKSILSFFTRDIGCASSIEVVVEAGLILTVLKQHVIYLDPMEGESGLMGGTLYNQLGVGDSGSPEERRALHNELRSMLGHPVIQVELNKEQLDICLNLALKELRKFSSYSYKRGVFFLDLKPNQQTYMLTNKCVGFNKVVGINSIHRSRGLAMSSATNDGDLFTYAAIQRLYSMGTFDMLTYHLVSAYMEELETLFANRIMFNWNELERELGVFQRVGKKERVLVDAFFERTEQDLMIDRQTSLWLQRWALAEAKMILSQSRGKFTSLPGPNGTTSLNGSELQAQAETEKTDLRAQLEDGSMQNFTGIGMRAHFIMG